MDEQRRKFAIFRRAILRRKNKIHRQQEVLSNQLVNFRREN